MYEYIFAAVVLLNETKTFAFVEPLNLTVFLDITFTFKYIYKTCHKRQLGPFQKHYLWEVLRRFVFEAESDDNVFGGTA